MSCDTFRPLPRLEIVGGTDGRGFLAALMLPRGVEEGVMLAAAPLVDRERMAGRSADNDLAEALEVGLDGVGGEEGEGKGESKGVSASKSGVDAVESIVEVVSDYVTASGHCGVRRREEWVD